jgi:hypothetical protein
MSAWDLRQAIEQAIPWWVPFAVPMAAVMGWFVWSLWRGR